MFVGDAPQLNQPLALALGSFDGLHLGHRAVLAAVTAHTPELMPAVISFSPHPRALLTGQAPGALLTPAQKQQTLAALGIPLEIPLDFSVIRDMEPEDFLEALAKALPLGMLACGYNFRFGRGGRGNTALLQQFCRQREIRCYVAQPVLMGGQAVSSTRIRQLLSEGQVAEAATLLGQPITYTAAVEAGDRRGRTIGFPTINQQFPTGIQPPRFGVYAALVQLDGQPHPAVTNVGMRPTYRVESPMLETYILHYSGDLYGKTLPVTLCKFLRPELKFHSLAELQAAIVQNKEQTENFFAADKSSL